MRLLLAAMFLVATTALAADEKPLDVAGTNAIEHARQLFEQAKFDQALALLDQADKPGPPTAESLDLRGLIFTEQGKFDQAAAAFDAAKTTSSSYFPARLHAADLLLRQNKFSEARPVYESLQRETTNLTQNERARYAVVVSCLGEKDDSCARTALNRIKFPTQSAAYYYAQAAWEFAHGNKSEGKKWMRAADGIFDPAAAAWFERSLYELGWIKKKPAPTAS